MQPKIDVDLNLPVVPLITDTNPLTRLYNYEYQENRDEKLIKWICKDISLLHLAVYTDDVQLVKKLLANGIDKEATFAACSEAVNAEDDPDEQEYYPIIAQCTALHLAVFLNKPEIVNLLIQAGVNLNSTFEYLDPRGIERWGIFIYTYKNFTPLHLAIHLENTALVNKLLVAGASISQTFNYEGTNGDDVEYFSDVTPLHHATRYNLKEIILLLLNAGSNIDDLYNSRYWSCHNGDDEGNYKCFEDLFDGEGFNMASEDDVNILSKISLLENGLCPLSQLPKIADSSGADLKNLFLKRGYGLVNNFSKAFMKNYIGAGANTENCLVIGMTIDGYPVTKETEGFENAITTLDELQFFLNISLSSSFNHKVHLNIVKLRLEQFELLPDPEKASLCKAIRGTLATQSLQRWSLFATRKGIQQNSITQQDLDRLPQELRTIVND